MQTYTPDTWVILLFDYPDYGKVHKVFAGWYGGYTQGDSWKLSSGIKTFVNEGKFYSSLQESGSTYNLYKQYERLSGYQHGLLNAWREQLDEVQGSVLVVDSLDFIEGLKYDF